jgi:hypothetical protein
MSIEAVGKYVFVAIMFGVLGLLVYKTVKNVYPSQIYTGKAYAEILQEQFKQHRRELLVQFYEMKLDETRPTDSPTVTVASHRPSLRWWEKVELCTLAVTMFYSNNIRKLRDFLDLQLTYKKTCVSREDCADKHLDTVENIDKYLKRIVKEHGGPLIDRNWNADTH